MIDVENCRLENLVSLEELEQLTAGLRAQGKKIGLGMGCFDLIHPGHINYLDFAKSLCDVLVVAVAKDRYMVTKELGSGRPIFSEDARSFVVGNLKPVDYVVLDEGITSEEESSSDIVYQIRPDVLIRGPDYVDKKDPITLQREEFMRSIGGETVYYDPSTKTKLSSTDVIAHIKDSIHL